MSVEDGNRKAIADLGLSLNFQNHGIRLNNNIGAGVNATSKNSHPLSELVWCPSKGISVKNTHRNRSLSGKESAILWGLGTHNNMAVSSAKSISTKLNSYVNFVGDKNDVSLVCPMNFDKVDAPGRVRLVTGSSTEGQDEDIRANTDVQTQTAYKKRKFEENKRNEENTNLGIPLVAVAGIGENQLLGCSPSREVGKSDAVSAIPGNGDSIAIPCQEGPSRQHDVTTAFVDEEGQSMLKTPGAITETSDKLEFSAENYILAEASKDANPEAPQRKGTHLVDEGVHAENYLKSRRKEEYLRKGKGKALSDGHINDQMADDNVSHGSAGSCNSKQSASSRNTKRSLDQQLMVTSKRHKQNTETDSVSFIRQSSSFRSWITNMVKGYHGCNQDVAPSSMLAGMLTTQAEQESRSLKPSGQELRRVGFRNLFQSIYCSNNNVKGRNIFLDYRSNEKSGDVKGSTMVDVSAVPLAAYETSSIIPKDSGQSSKICDQPTSGTRNGRPSEQGIILSSNFLTKQIKVLPRMNTLLCNVANGMDIAKSNQSISSDDKERDHISEYTEEKEAQPVGQKRDYLGSLWITRFRPKIAQPASNMITSDFISKRVLLNSEKIISSEKGLMDEIQGEHSGDPLNSHSEGRNGFTKHEGLVGCEQVNVKDEQNSEVMASVFARRLDALKQVVPFDATCKQAPMIPTCFFCGVRGHDIKSCSEITEGELEELFHVIKSSDKFKDSTCLCIKCFQLSHWAMECPQRPSRKSALGSFVGWSNDIDLYSQRRDKERQNNLLEKNNHLVQTLAPQRISGERNFVTDTKLIQLQDSSKLNQDIADARNPIDPLSGGREVGKSSSPPPNKISATREGVFDAVRRLRMSRSDFLSRLMDSQISPSRLRGFYLRVRLSNWKEGLGGKGYCVACINGALEQTGLETSVKVTIGSFTCLVESRYISNQDFLESELMTWWTETAKCGHCQNPSLEELEQKYEERLRLGF